MSTGKNTDAVLAQQLIAGAKLHLTNVTSVTLESTSLTPAQIEASLQTLIDLRSAVNDAKATTQAKISAEVAQAPALRSRMAAFVAFVKASFGTSPDVMADFGLKPKKVTTPLTIEQKAASAAKRAATRAARHTLGTKQKKAVKGTITTIVSTPTSPAPTASPAVPATPTASPVTPATPATPAAPAPASPPVAASPVAGSPSPGASAGTAPHATA